MRNSLRLGVILIALSAAQTQKRLADEREYDLFRRAAGVDAVAGWIAVLLEWEDAYPNSDFHRERLQSSFVSPVSIRRPDYESLPGNERERRIKAKRHRRHAARPGGKQEISTRTRGFRKSLRDRK